MKPLPDINLSFEGLSKLLQGPIQAQLLFTGIKLKVFNYLSIPVSAESVAQDMGAHQGNMRLFLDGLTSMELILKKNGLYQNTPVAQTFLVEESQTYLGQMLFSIAGIQHAKLNDLPKMIMEGPPPPSSEADMRREDRWARATAYLANYQRAGIAQEMTKIISDLPEFPGFRKMLDLGGGPGLIGIAIVAAHPSMKGVIFDLPAVVKAAESFIREYEMEDRIKILAGNYNHDSIGEGYDLIWASLNLYFARENINRFMKKIYNALSPGGVFISYHEGLTHERTKPERHVIGRISLALMDQDMSFDQGFIANAMLDVGFKSVHSRTLNTPNGPIDLDICRK